MYRVDLEGGAVLETGCVYIVEIQERLREFMKGRTTIVITHRLSAITDADLILVLDDGRLVEQGRHADLAAAGCPYAKLWESQKLTEEYLASQDCVVVVTDHRGLPLSAPLSVEPNIAWVGYANRSIRTLVEPALRRALASRPGVPTSAPALPGSAAEVGRGDAERSDGVVE